MSYAGVIWNNEPVDFKDIKEKMGVLADMMLVEDEDFTYRKSDVSATRLSSIKNVCTRKAYYQARLPVYVEPRKIWTMNRGKLIHYGFKSLPNKELRLMAGIRLSMSDPKLIVLQGILDGYDEINGIIYEIKDTGWLPNEPRDSHITQVAIYAYMLKSMNMRYRGVRFIYTAPKDFKVFDAYVEPMSEEEIKELIKKYLIHKDNLGGGKIASWACDYCEFRNICDKAEPTSRVDRKEMIYIPPDKLSEMESELKGGT